MIKRLCKRYASRLILFVNRHTENERVRHFLRKLNMRIFSTLPITMCAKRSETVMQCGCWRIETVMRWVEAVGGKGTVIVVEADDLNCMILDVERKRRRLHNVIIVNKALMDKKGRVTFMYSDNSPTNQVKDLPTYGTAPRSEYKEKTVEADTLDNILAEIGIDSVDHIHFTISGAEFLALDGMKTLLKPGLRIFSRSTCLHHADDQPVRKEVVQKMRSLGLETTLGRAEANRHMGGNIYAVMPQAGEARA